MDDWEKFMEMISLDQKGLFNQFTSLGSLFNILLSAIFGFMILFVCIKTHGKSKINKSLITTIPLLAILMTVLMRMRGGHIAVFFGIFGVLSIVRFRSSLTNQKDITFILFSIITGVLIGIGNYLLALITFIIIIIVIIIINFIINKTNKKQNASLFVLSSDKPFNILQSEIESFLLSNNFNFQLNNIYGKFDVNEKKNIYKDEKNLEYIIYYNSDKEILEKYDLINDFIKDKGITLELKKNKIL
ncbi:MAG: DUF4956 domain-containing protein [Spirochaetes bacterium]|nr:DUF4956 domain-containing protein [Spirochaetota bacterium]